MEGGSLSTAKQSMAMVVLYLWWPLGLVNVIQRCRKAVYTQINDARDEVLLAKHGVNLICPTYAYAKRGTNALLIFGGLPAVPPAVPPPAVPPPAVRRRAPGTPGSVTQSPVGPAARSSLRASLDVFIAKSACGGRVSSRPSFGCVSNGGSRRPILRQASMSRAWLLRLRFHVALCSCEGVRGTEVPGE